MNYELLESDNLEILTLISSSLGVKVYEITELIKIKFVVHYKEKSCSSLIYSIRVVVFDSDRSIVSEARFLEVIIINELRHFGVLSFVAMMFISFITLTIIGFVISEI